MNNEWEYYINTHRPPCFKCSIWISSPHGQQPPTSWWSKAGSAVDAELIIVLRGHLVFFLLFLFRQSWPIFSQQPLIVGVFSLIAAEVQLCRTLCSLTSKAFERWICFRKTTSDFPASFTPITRFFWSRQSSLDFPFVLFGHQSLKFQQLLTIRITLKMWGSGASKLIWWTALKLIIYVAVVVFLTQLKPQTIH